MIDTTGGGVNGVTSGVPHDGGGVGQPDKERQRIQLRQQLDDLSKRVDVLERLQREKKMIP